MTKVLEHKRIHFDDDALRASKILETFFHEFQPFDRDAARSGKIIAHWAALINAEKLATNECDHGHS